MAGWKSFCLRLIVKGCHLVFAPDAVSQLPEKKKFRISQIFYFPFNSGNSNFPGKGADSSKKGRKLLIHFSTKVVIRIYVNAGLTNLKRWCTCNVFLSHKTVHKSWFNLENSWTSKIDCLLDDQHFACLVVGSSVAIVDC